MSPIPAASLEPSAHLFPGLSIGGAVLSPLAPAATAVTAAARAFPAAQRLLAGTAERRLPQRYAVGWHGTDADATRGAFAVIARDSGLDELLGEVVRLATPTREIFVVVIGARGVPAPISVTRRAFLGLGRLAHESLTCSVEVVS